MQKSNEELLRELKDGREEALSELLSQNAGLIRSVALRFMGRGTDYEDLTQLASIGLIKAARGFDFSHGTVFSTYAVVLIIGEIRRFLRDDGLIKVSRNQKALAVRIARETEEFVKEHGRSPHIAELCGITGATAEEIGDALDASTPVRSIYERTGGDDSPSLCDVISDESGELERAAAAIDLSEAMKILSQEQRRILSLRYFHELSQQRTGEILGLSQVKVSREEKKILSLLRSRLTG